MKLLHWARGLRRLEIWRVYIVVMSEGRDNLIRRVWRVSASGVVSGGVAGKLWDIGRTVESSVEGGGGAGGGREQHATWGHVLTPSVPLSAVGETY